MRRRGRGGGGGAMAEQLGNPLFVYFVLQLRAGLSVTGGRGACGPILSVKCCTFDERRGYCHSWDIWGLLNVCGFTEAQMST